MLLCLLHVASGIMLIIFGCCFDSGVFALWAITNEPWPAIATEDDMSSTRNYVVFLQVACWVCGAINFILVFFMAWLVITFSSLIFSPKPWVFEQWNKERKYAINWITGADKKKHVRQRDEMKLWKTMNLSQHNELEKYNQEGMFKLKKLNPELV